MNAASKMLPNTLYSSRTGFSEVLFSKRILMIILLGSAIFVSSIGDIYVKTLNRHLYSELQISQTEKNQLQVEGSQLLLEESTWSTQSRVDRIANTDLNMQLPRAQDIILVRDE